MKEIRKMEVSAKILKYNYILGEKRNLAPVGGVLIKIFYCRRNNENIFKGRKSIRTSRKLA